MPIQSAGGQDAQGRVELAPEYAEGLRNLEDFGRIWVLFLCHRAKPARLTVKPFLDPAERGVFATRAPSRPNPLGLSSVEVLSIAGTVIHVSGVDMLDGSPVLDIKPYIPAFDVFPGARCDWAAAAKLRETESDNRFEA